MTNLIGAVGFRYDPASQAVIFVPLGADGLNAATTANPAPVRLNGADGSGAVTTANPLPIQIKGYDDTNAASSSNPFITESFTHSKIGKGKTFVHNNTHTALGAGASYYHILTTGASIVHLTIFSTTSTVAPIYVELREGDTFTGGTSGTIVNKNRGSAIASTCTVTEGVTISVAGTHLEGDYTAGTKQTGGSSAIEAEWILKANTNYAIQIRNDSAGAGDVSLHLEWYEV